MNVLNTTQDHIGFVPQPGDGFAQFIVNFRQVMATQVLEFDVLQILPDALSWVQIGRVAGQTLQMNVLGSALRQEVFDHLPMMGGQAIPDDEQLALDVAQQVTQETDDIRTFESVVLNHDVQVTTRRNGTDDREVIPTQRKTQDGRLPSGRVSAHSGRQQVEARFIDKYYGSPLICGFF